MKKISIVVPAHNEEANIPLLVKEVESVFSTLKDFTYELVIVDDGSRDNTMNVIKDESQKNTNIKYLEFSKNFGKEAATSAGIHYASGDAVLSLDADLQHPPSLVPDFIKKWEEGYDVVIGVRTKNMGTTFVKRFLSALYYKIINSISTTEIVRGATDYRLIDRRVVDEFNRLTEHERMTRGLIDWLGFKRCYINFVAGERANGEAAYSYLKLIKLAISSSVAHSLFPLKLAGYLGLFITITSGMVGFLVFVNRYIFDDYMSWHISGPAQLAILMIFFIGIVLCCLGLIALYIGNIIHEVTGRPLYVVRDTNILK